MDCKRFIQKTFEFMKSDSRSLSWRERLVQSFGKDPLTCPNCKEKCFYGGFGILTMEISLI
nr:hypothetical protein [Candidatus Electrothrix aestuarii]